MKSGKSRCSAAKGGVQDGLDRASVKLLRELAEGRNGAPRSDAERRRRTRALDALRKHDLVAVGADGRLRLNAAGRAHLARVAGQEPFRDQHRVLENITVKLGDRTHAVRRNITESPLGWLRRRRGGLLPDASLDAGERLREDFTIAGLAPRVTMNWEAPVAQTRRADGGAEAGMTDMVVAARQRVRRALEAVGPEFSGLLLDVCCFLKGLEEVERARGWPVRSAKVVIALGLQRLARHYGIGQQPEAGRSRGIRQWKAPECRPLADGA